MKRIVYLLLGMLLIVLGIGFAYRNSQTVTFDYYFGIHWEGPLSLMLLTFFVLGVTAGLLASLAMVARMQRRLVRARRDVRQLEQEVTNLRALPIRDML